MFDVFPCTRRSHRCGIVALPDGSRHRKSPFEIHNAIAVATAFSIGEAEDVDSAPFGFQRSRLAPFETCSAKP